MILSPKKAFFFLELDKIDTLGLTMHTYLSDFSFHTFKDKHT